MTGTLAVIKYSIDTTDNPYLDRLVFHESEIRFMPPVDRIILKG